MRYIITAVALFLFLLGAALASKFAVAQFLAQLNLPF